MKATTKAYARFPGVNAWVEHADGTNADQLALIDKAINYDSAAHHSAVNDRACAKLHGALRSRKVEAWIPVVEDVAAGATVGFPSVITVWNEAKKEFTHRAAFYGEDTSIFADVSRSFRTLTKWNNEKGLGTWFEAECIKQWAGHPAADSMYGGTPAALIGEYRPEGSAIISIMSKLGAKLGTEANGIKEVDGRTLPNHSDANAEPIAGQFLSPSGKSLNHIFPVNWSSIDGKQQLCATFTEGISSFSGDTVIRVQVTSNGNIPEKTVLKDVLAAMLKTGQTEIDGNPNRKWGARKSTQPSPIINIGGSRRDLQISAFSVAGNDTLRATKIALAPSSLMRVHAFDAAIVDALPGRTRLLGSHIMRPVAVTFANIPKSVLGLDVVPSKPLAVAPAATDKLIFE